MAVLFVSELFVIVVVLRSPSVYSCDASPAIGRISVIVQLSIFSGTLELSIHAAAAAIGTGCRGRCC